MSEVYYFEYELSNQFIYRSKFDRETHEWINFKKVPLTAADIASWDSEYGEEFYTCANLVSEYAKRYFPKDF